MVTDEMDEMDEPVTKLTQVLERDDGTQVRIVAYRCFGRNLEPYDHADVFRRSPEHGGWELAPEGEVDRYASAEEIEEIRSGLGRPLSYYEGKWLLV
jgi:hypothetical protein